MASRTGWNPDLAHKTIRDRMISMECPCDDHGHVHWIDCSGNLLEPFRKLKMLLLHCGWKDAQRRIKVAESLVTAPDREVKELASREAAVSDWQGADPITLKAAAIWVAEHISVKGIKPKDAPNGTAWGMLVWARDNNKDFYSGLPRYMATEKDEKQGSGVFEDDKRDKVDLMQTIIEAKRESRIAGKRGLQEVADVAEAT